MAKARDDRKHRIKILAFFALPCTQKIIQLENAILITEETHSTYCWILVLLNVTIQIIFIVSNDNILHMYYFSIYLVPEHFILKKLLQMPQHNYHSQQW
jgi:hypothetical protein